MKKPNKNGRGDSIAQKKLGDYAPEMLAILEHIVTEADHPDNERDTDLVLSLNWKKIRLVLSKAKKAEK